MIKKLVMLLVVVVASISLVVVACAPEAAPPLPEEEVAPEEVAPEEVAPEAPREEVFEWSFVSFGTFVSTPWLVPYMEAIEEASGGAITIAKLEAGMHPYGPADLLSACRDRSAELVWIPALVTRGVEPIASIFDMPFLMGSKAEADELYALMEDPDYADVREAAYEDVNKRWNAIGLLYLGWWGYAFGTPDTPVTSSDSLKGKKIRVFSKELGGMVKLFGGIPVTIDSAEVYTGLQRGTVDGAVTAYSHFYLMRWTELIKYITMCPYCQGLQWISVNKDAWEELPPYLKNIVLEVSAEWQQKVREHQERVQLEAMKNAIIADGVTFTWMPEALQREAREKMRPIWAEWAAEVGPSGATILERIDEFHREFMEEQ